MSILSVIYRNSITNKNCGLTECTITFLSRKHGAPLHSTFSIFHVQMPYEWGFPYVYRVQFWIRWPYRHFIKILMGPKILSLFFSNEQRKKTHNDVLLLLKTIPNNEKWQDLSPNRKWFAQFDCCLGRNIFVKSSVLDSVS